MIELAGSFVLAAPLNAASERVHGRLKQLLVGLVGLESKSWLAAVQPIAIDPVDAVLLHLRPSRQRFCGRRSKARVGTRP